MSNSAAEKVVEKVIEKVEVEKVVQVCICSELMESHPVYAYPCFGCI